MSGVNNNVVIVGTSKAVQKSRLLARGHSVEMMEKRLSAQLTTSEKINKISDKISKDKYGYLGYIDGNQDMEHNIENFGEQVKWALGYEL